MSSASGMSSSPSRSRGAWLEVSPELPGACLGSGARVGLVALLAALTAWVLAPALAGSHVYDDIALVQRNPWVSSLDAALAGFLEPLWGFADARDAASVGFWRPLTIVVLALGRAWTGEDPSGGHWLSLVVYVLAGLAAWRLMAELLQHQLAGFAIALLWLLHPMSIQAGAWISAVNDGLSALFVLLTLTAFVRWRRAGSRFVPLSAGVWLLLGLLCKEQALVALPLAFLLDLLVLRFGASEAEEQTPDVLRSWSPLLVVVVLWWALRWSVFGSPAAGLGGALVDLGLGTGRSILLRGEALGAWTWSALTLEGRPFFRPVRPVLALGDPDAREVWLGLAAWLALGAAALLRRSAGLRLAFLALPASILPVLIDPERAGAFPVADRHALLLALIASALLVGLSTRLLRGGLALAPLLLLALLAIPSARDRSALYADNITFHRRATVESPDVAPAWWGLGRELLARYQVTKEDGLVDEAMAAFLKTLALGHDYGARQPVLAPDAPVADRLNELLTTINDPKAKPTPDERVMVSTFDRLQGNLGQAWCYLLNALVSSEPDFDTPADVFRAVAQAMPSESEPRVGLGVTLMSAGDLPGAEQELREATALDERNVEAWTNLGTCLGRMGKRDEAVGAFQTAAGLRPDRRNRVRLVTAMVDAGQLTRAGSLLEELSSEFPADAELHYLEGVRTLSNRDLARSLAAFDQALALEPDMGEAHRYRGAVLAQLDRRAEAIDALGRACELMPESFDAHYRTAQLLLADEATAPSARPYLEVAYLRSPPGEIRAALGGYMAEFAGEDPDALMNLARVEQGRGDWNAALRWTERVLAVPEAWNGRPQRDQNLAKVHQVRGILFERLARSAEALEEYARSLELAPRTFWTLHNLGLLEARLGRPDLARPHLALALEELDQVGPADEPGNLRGAVQSTLEGVLQSIDAGAGSMGPFQDLPTPPRDQ